MTIDTQRLATDAGYWDMVAPDGATHFNAHGVGSKWWRQSEDRFYERVAEKWNERLLYPKRLIPRPKTAPEEWVDGLPPVGTVVEVHGMTYGGNGDMAWKESEVYAHVNGRVLAESTYQANTFVLYTKNEIRPIRTKQERQRDELVQVIQGADIHPIVFGHAANIADAIIADGWTKP